MDRSNPRIGHPISKEARSFVNIIDNFTDPREVVREAISNALDWKATEIAITIWKDSRRADKELVIQIRDNGVGLTLERFQAFWNLADTSDVKRDSFGKKEGNRTGEKGYGTKTYWKCRELTVESVSSGPYGNHWHVLGWMMEPANTLISKEIVPDYEYVEENVNGDTPTYTEITIRGFNVRSDEEFRHEAIKDYILWFTRFGSVEREFGIHDHEGATLTLHGLGVNEGECLRFGHRFPEIANNVRKLQREFKDSWPKYYVNKWVFPSVEIEGYPDSSLSMVFYIEGDSAKRRYNEMLSAPGRQRQHWRYSVMDRYGIYVCRDYIPLPPSERVNDWVSPGRSEWTLYHAFINCQDFQITANRASIGNTDRHFLTKVKDTVEDLFKTSIKGSNEYRVYQDEIDATNQRSSVDLKESDEKEDIDKRYYHAKKKRVALYHCSKRPTVKLFEPRQEIEVLILFSIAKALRPDLFEFKIVDYSTSRGIDALCQLETGHGGLHRGNLRYVEFKKTLALEFKDHTFSNLTAIVCWECNLEDGAKVYDFAGNERTLCITNVAGYPVYTLLPPPEIPLPPIKVYVLKQYLADELKLSFEAQMRDV